MKWVWERESYGDSKRKILEGQLEQSIRPADQKTIRKDGVRKEIEARQKHKSNKFFSAIIFVLILWLKDCEFIQ